MNNGGWQHLANPYGNGIKIYLHDLLGPSAVVNNQEILDRIARVIVNEHDYKQFGKLVSTIYEIAHIRALGQIAEHKEVLERHGLRINVLATNVNEKKEGEKIFKDQEENSG
jgi:hypothetical protein